MKKNPLSFPWFSVNVTTPGFHIPTRSGTVRRQPARRLQRWGRLGCRGTMNSLKFKILNLTMLILVVVVGFTAWHNLRTQRAMLVRFADQNSRIIGDTIRNGIVTHMANGQNAEVGRILEKIKREPAIEAVRIFDESGIILTSGIPEEIGSVVSPADLLAYRGHNYSFAELTSGKEYHSVLVPIYNAPTCYTCHGDGEKVLGILNVHLSLRAIESLQTKGRQATLISSAGMLLILTLAIYGFILIYVDRPIRRLVASMTQLENGQFDQAKIQDRSSGEMNLLFSKFNLMVDRLKGLLDTTITHEREIAITQEKLAYHNEIRSMNLTLEERLKEIEYLNITLEERIEEIEEANYKIADLASDLEDKNTNLENAVSRLAALYEMGLGVNSTMDIERLFSLLVHKTMTTLKARIGYILLLDEERSVLHIASSEGLPAHIDENVSIPLKPGGCSHWVVSKRQPLLLQDINEAAEFSRISRLGFTRESVICAPLLIKDEIIGTITIANKIDTGAFTHEDLEMLSTIAAQASIAINNARLYEEQQHTYLSTVQALVSTIEASDAYTRGHSERVTRYSLALARHLNLRPEAVRLLEQAAILHDIGKIGIGTALLHKEGKLSPAEMEVLCQHPTIGVRILEPIHFLKGVREIIEQHHERFDGKGYPRGLADSGIAIEARILAVADTYDAMTSSRPYRQARSHATALTEINQQAGTQFDPEVAAAFIDLCENGGLTA
jgi:putative nucleotidyltransferase with HDIG domain